MAQLQLLHLADSALPIGGAAHSLGLETLIAEGHLDVHNLQNFFSDYLDEAGQIEAVFCRAGFNVDGLSALNERYGACRPARESREASLKLGRRFLSLAASLVGDLPAAEAHLCIAFGMVGRALALDCDLVAAAYLHQVLFGQISACQRLLPLGQTEATGILWRLKPHVLAAIETSKSMSVDDAWCCQPALDIASMRHPRLTTRLFIS